MVVKMWCSNTDELFINFFFNVYFSGSVYMNGDVGKVPQGAVYTATPEQHAPSPTTDFRYFIKLIH